MSPLRRLGWPLLGLLVLGLMVWGQLRRAEGGRFLSELEGWSVSKKQISADSFTGWKDEARRVLPRAIGQEPLDLIRQTQEAAQQGRWRYPVVDYDSFPESRPANVPLLYRWYYDGLGRWVAGLSGLPVAVALEQSLGWADAFWQVAGASIALMLLWRKRGAATAVLFAMGWATLFPLAGRFLQGAGDYRAALLVLWLWQWLCLVPKNSGQSRAPRAWAVLAGALAALGGSLAPEAMAVLLFVQVVVLVGLAAVEPSSLRAWAWSGALVWWGLCGVLWGEWKGWGDVAEVHPSLALAWFGAVELALSVRESVRAGRLQGWGGAMGFLFVVPWLACGLGGPTENLWRRDAQWAIWPGQPLAEWGTLAQALVHGEGWQAWWVLLGQAALLVATLVLWRRRHENRFDYALLVGALLLSCFGWWQLRWWSYVQVLGWLGAVGLWVQATGRLRRLWAGLVAAYAGVGGVFSWSNLHASAANSLSIAEGERLVLRDVGHWLRRRAGDQASFLAPPESVAAIGFAGNLRGLGGSAWENREAVVGALRVANATSPDEAFELMTKRGLQYLVIPSWDKSMEALILRSRNVDTLPPAVFWSALQRWEQPRWLRPVAYPAPAINGMEDHRVTVFQVVEEQDDVTAMARMAEYFVEIRDGAGAGAADRFLEAHPSDLTALVARASLAMATENQAAFAAQLNRLLPLVQAGAAATLPWDRQVSLAVVLAQARQFDQVRALLSSVLAEVDEVRLRELSPTSLLRLLVLSRRSGVPFSDPALEVLGVSLLPEAARSQLPATAAKP